MNYSFAELRRVYDNNVCTNIVQTLLDYIGQNQIPIPSIIRIVLCAIIVNIPRILPYQGYYSKLMYNVLIDTFCKPYIDNTFNEFQKLAITARIDGTIQTARSTRQKVEYQVFNPLTKQYEKRVSHCLQFKSFVY